MSTTYEQGPTEEPSTQTIRPLDFDPVEVYRQWGGRNGEVIATIERFVGERAELSLNSQ